MGKLTKEAYTAKEVYAVNKVLKNSEAAIENGASEEQAEVITWLCSSRHFLHSNAESFFVSESSTADKINKLLSDVYPDSINNRLRACGLPTIQYEQPENIADDSTYELDGLDYDEAETLAVNYICDVDILIIKYLQDFDKKYHTDFAPTLNARYADVGGVG